MTAYSAAIQWSPKVYANYAGPRAVPLHDLLAAVRRLQGDKVFDRIADVGSGTGAALQGLSTLFGPVKSIDCVDTDMNMVQATTTAADGVKAALATDGGPAVTDLPTISSAQMDAHSFYREPPQGQNASYDLIFSNAVFHWVSDHARLISGLWSRLSPGGVLAFQMPDTRKQPSHLLMLEAAKNVGQGDAAAEIGYPTTRMDPQDYYRIFNDPELITPKFDALELFHVDYHHLLDQKSVDPESLASSAEVLPQHCVHGWTKSTGLMPLALAMQERGGNELKSRFEREYTRLLWQAYPPIDNTDKVMLTYRRFFVAARKATNAA
eukprot:Clim_evm3s46 gene=Clim_evmTU3s46